MDICTAVSRRLRKGESHFTAASIADKSHRVDRFLSWTGRDHDSNP
jgi:hypothetical protein